MCKYFKTGLIVTVILLYYAGSPVFGQGFIVKSKVLDTQTEEALPFANIMLLNQTIGATSDISGSFTLHLPEKYRNDTLVISYMGYETRKILVSEIKPDGVHLRAKSKELKTFQFIPGRKKTVVLNPFRARKCFLPSDNIVSSNLQYWFPSRPHEPTIQAMFFSSPNTTNYFIKEVWVHTESFSFPASFRLRFFQANENYFPGDDLLSENIIVETSKRSELIKIDMEKHNLVLPENGLFVGVELLIIPENLHYAVLPEASDSIALYSPFLSFFPAKDKNDAYWVYSKGSWQKKQLQLYEENKKNGYLPAISLKIEN